MLTTQQTTHARDDRGAGWRVCALVVAGSLLADAAATQAATPERPNSRPQPAIAAGPDLRDRGADPEPAAVRPVEPLVSGNLRDPVWRKLRMAFATAQKRVRGEPACAAMFTDLGADAFQLLTKARFAPAATETNREVCERATAGTALGSHQIVLCPAFATVSVNDAATVLIHEMLHHAGMGEKPVDPGGLTPEEINRLVQARCGR